VGEEEEEEEEEEEAGDKTANKKEQTYKRTQKHTHQCHESGRSN